MANRCYVNSIAQVSCQKPLSDEWFDSPCIYGDKYVRAQEPDTKGLIVPAEARRMSKILKRTVCTAITALNESDINNLTSYATISEFTKQTNATLTVMRNGEHWFHTEEQMKFLDEWINKSAR